MPISDGDAREILRALDETVRRAANLAGTRGERLSGLDRVAMDRFRRGENAKASLAEYLVSLADGVGGGSRQAAILHKLRQYISTSNGQPIDGISVVLSPRDRDICGVDEAELDEDPAATKLADRLREIAHLIYQG